MVETKEDSDVIVITKKKSKTQKPRMYKVILHNDDYTSMDFVVDILESIFHKTPVIATQIMMEIHHKGKGVCGIYTRDVAESKVRQVEEKSLQEGYPLLCTMELE